MKCGSCGGEDIKLVTGADIYPRRADLHERNFWRCACGAYVGCHSGTEQPYGTPANEELRRLRMRTHEAFDPYWEKYGMTRTETYTFLANRLKVPAAECHIGMFNADQCKRAVEICHKWDRYIEHVMKIGMATGFSGFEGNALDSPEYHDRERWMRSLESSIAHSEYEDECVNAGKCPVCGGPVRKTIEKWQHGPVELALEAGTWVSYRCASHPPIGTVRPLGVCEWTGFDRKEPIGEN
jgi:hypothetical protein